ncbi:sensor histidine kinase [Enterocloster lavalensis]|uniref:sensor histidine kinase n=1 Tax=Enterocloster lavalensis TaxID=460384 RepID=UPI0023F1739C|nr:HAMP domain-containing sensor histidine kinase [Enterocloster lavalensis]
MSRTSGRSAAIGFAAGFALGGILAACAYVAWAAGRQYGQLARLAGQLSRRWPGNETEIVGMIKAASEGVGDGAAAGMELLRSYGFEPVRLASGFGPGMVLLTLAGLGAFLGILWCAWRRERRRKILRIGELTAYLEQSNRKEGAGLLAGQEDDFSPLQDEIYKTVTALRLAAEREEKARREFADRLADVAHQIKTPVTSIAITAQALDRTGNDPGLNRIRRQTERLEQLVETLLTFARIDSGALRLEKQEVDVYTALELAAETVEPVLHRRQIDLELPNHPGISFSGDLEWTAQAFINLFKNCADHAPQGGRIAVEYGENPLYTEITVRDNGPGFAPEELPYIFQRFYQGKRNVGGEPGSGVGDGRDAGEGVSPGEEAGQAVSHGEEARPRVSHGEAAGPGVSPGSSPAPRLNREKGAGLGLALAKSVIELQGGFIEARNLPEGGACFTVRFYCHRDVTFL